MNIITTTFNEHEQEIRFIRETVFIKEQAVPPELEWDEHDATAQHLLAYHDKQAVATARMLDDGHIGRLSVLAEYRHMGIGSRMLTTLIEMARERELTRIFLSAQVAAIPFYQRHGLIVISEEFLDAGIPHKEMELLLI